MDTDPCRRELKPVSQPCSQPWETNEMWVDCEKYFGCKGLRETGGDNGDTRDAVSDT